MAGPGFYTSLHASHCTPYSEAAARPQFAPSLSTLAAPTYPLPPLPNVCHHRQNASPLPAAASPTAPHARRLRLPNVASPTKLTLYTPPLPDAGAACSFFTLCANAEGVAELLRGVHMPACAGKGSHDPVSPAAAAPGRKEDSVESSCEHCPLSSTHRPRVLANFSQLVGCTWRAFAYFLLNFSLLWY